jgi:hypothetical protein
LPSEPEGGTSGSGNAQAAAARSGKHPVGDLPLHHRPDHPHRSHLQCKGNDHDLLDAGCLKRTRR